MNKFEIEFYNGLIKGIVKCAGILKESGDLREANEKIDCLLKKVQRKIDAMVEERKCEITEIEEILKGEKTWKKMK